jgi:hypothetical protein
MGTVHKRWAAKRSRHSSAKLVHIFSHEVPIVRKLCGDFLKRRRNREDWAAIFSAQQVHHLSWTRLTDGIKVFAPDHGNHR